MSSYHKDLDYENYKHQSVCVIFDPIVIAVSAVAHPQREFTINEAKFIAFAWEWLQKAADWNSRLDRKYDYVIDNIRKAEKQLQTIVKLTDIDGYSTNGPHTQEECKEKIRIYASWILRQVFEIGEPENE